MFPEQKMGHRDGSSQGYVVTLSDLPCTNGECPSDESTTVCESSFQNEPVMCGADGYEACSPIHDCGGATGRYLRVQLPGGSRILDVELLPHRSKPVPPVGDDGNPDENAMMCWGVKRPTSHDLPFPVTAYVTSRDPDDPVYFSTCYARDDAWVWLEPPVQEAVARLSWAVNGKCLSC